MTITATEFKTNLGKYLDLAYSEDILITRNGKVIAQLSQPQVNKLALLDRLTGIAKLSEKVTLDDIKSERLKNK